MCEPQLVNRESAFAAFYFITLKKLDSSQSYSHLFTIIIIVTAVTRADKSFPHRL